MIARPACGPRARARALPHRSRHQIKAVEDSSDPSDDDVDVCLDDCVCIDYKPVNGKPGFLIETRDDEFWAPIAHII